MSDLVHQLEAFMHEYGWAFDRVGDGRWTTGFRTSERFYPLTIRLNGTTVQFEIVQLIGLDLDWHKRPDLMQFILHLNQNRTPTKLALDETDQLTLSISLLCSQLDKGTFEQAIEILAHHADDMTGQILAKISLPHFFPKMQLNC